MKPTRRWVGPVSGLLLCSLANVAIAQQPSQAQTAAIKQSCRSDYQSYCSSVPTGGKAALQCLQQNQANLSPSCRTAVAAVAGGEAAPGAPPQAPMAAAPGAAPPMSRRQEMMMLRNACGGDFRAYCRGVELGGGRAMACLAANEQRLSPPCKSALAEAHAAR